MIKLSKSPNIPETLQSASVVQEKQRISNIIVSGANPSSKDFKSELYGATDVRTQLLSDQHNKCVFCECTLLSQDGGEVEHYRPKTAYRQDSTPRNTQKPAYHNLAYDWHNLSVCCHACNRRKSTFFPLRDNAFRFNLQVEEPLILNPYIIDPIHHVEFRRAKLFARVDEHNNVDEKGRNTITLIGLNRKDLLELRKRKYNKFIREMNRQGISFDEKLQQDIHDEFSEGRTEESIEFLGMFKNQKYKF